MLNGWGSWGITKGMPHSVQTLYPTTSIDRSSTYTCVSQAWLILQSLCLEIIHTWDGTKNDDNSTDDSILVETNRHLSQRTWLRWLSNNRARGFACQLHGPRGRHLSQLVLQFLQLFKLLQPLLLLQDLLEDSEFSKAAT